MPEVFQIQCELKDCKICNADAWTSAFRAGDNKLVYHIECLNGECPNAAGVYGTDPQEVINNWNKLNDKT